MPYTKQLRNLLNWSVCVCVCVCRKNQKNKLRLSVSYEVVSPRKLFIKYFNRSQFPVKCHYSVSAHMYACKVPQLIGLHFREIISDC